MQTRTLVLTAVAAYSPQEVSALLACHVLGITLVRLPKWLTKRIQWPAWALLTPSKRRKKKQRMQPLWPLLSSLPPRWTTPSTSDTIVKAVRRASSSLPSSARCQQLQARWWGQPSRSLPTSTSWAMKTWPIRRYKWSRSRRRADLWRPNLPAADLRSSLRRTTRSRGPSSSRAITMSTVSMKDMRARRSLSCRCSARVRNLTALACQCPRTTVGETVSMELRTRFSRPWIMLTRWRWPLRHHNCRWCRGRSCSTGVGRALPDHSLAMDHESNRAYWEHRQGRSSSSINWRRTRRMQEWTERRGRRSATRSLTWTK